MSKVTVGADPEMFVQKDGRIVHAIGLVGGTKDRPFVVPCGALQEDNVLLEFNIDPVSEESDFVHHINFVMEQSGILMSQHDMDLCPKVSSHIYEENDLFTFPDSAFQFGCTPDYNALTGEPNESPSAENQCLRTAGGHVHIGFADYLGRPITKQDQNTVGLMCDYYLGLPSLLMDDDNLRRELYGKASAIRYKSYGVEYRTLSNFWIWEESTIRWAYQQAIRAVQDMGRFGELQGIIPIQEVQRVINDNDRVAAKAMLEVLDATQRK
jgi:hypothetical protein